MILYGWKNRRCLESKNNESIVNNKGMEEN